METTQETSLFEKIEGAIHQLRPFLEADGGDIKLLRIEGNIVKVKLLGACYSCNMSAMTLKAGIEEAVKKVAPEILRVEAVEE
ncbi:MAG: NifU family protein [Flavobacteriales bacterium]|nr:NifU family protein [Flavobacteriales bacterium]